MEFRKTVVGRLCVAGFRSVRITRIRPTMSRTQNVCALLMNLDEVPNADSPYGRAYVAGAGWLACAGAGFRVLRGSVARHSQRAEHQGATSLSRTWKRPVLKGSSA